MPEEELDACGGLCSVEEVGTSSLPDGVCLQIKTVKQKLKSVLVVQRAARMKEQSQEMKVPESICTTRWCSAAPSTAAWYWDKWTGNQTLPHHRYMECLTQGRINTTEGMDRMLDQQFIRLAGSEEV